MVTRAAWLLILPAGSLVSCASSAPPAPAPGALLVAPPSATVEPSAKPCPSPPSYAWCEAPLVFPRANQRASYFTVHHVAEAHELSQGDTVGVGILDHSFGLRAHPELYAGAKDFAGAQAMGTLDEESHGYWMALTVREIAPGAQIYALNTASTDEAAKVDAMVRAIDWAAQNNLRVLTYSSRRFDARVRPRLDEAVARAVGQGVVTTFIHYPHAQNLLPSWLGGRTGDDEREPDVNVLHYDYKVVFPKPYREYQATGKATGWDNFRPFLSLSSTSPVTAGIVALMLSANPSLSPAQCKAILMSTARPLEFEGRRAPRAVDARAAVERALGMRR